MDGIIRSAIERIPFFCVILTYFTRTGINSKPQRDIQLSMGALKIWGLEIMKKERERRNRRLLAEYADGLGMWRRRQLRCL